MISLAQKSHPEVEVNLATSFQKYKPNLQLVLFHSATESFQAGLRCRIELVGETSGAVVAVFGRLEVAHERLRGELRHGTTGGVEHCRVRGDDDDVLAVAMLCRKPLEQRVGVRGVPHGQRPSLGVRPDAVEDEHASCTLHRNEARERIDELGRLCEVSGVQEVVAVEEVEARVRHVDGELRKGEARQRR